MDTWQVREPRPMQQRSQRRAVAIASVAVVGALVYWWTVYSHHTVVFDGVETGSVRDIAVSGESGLVCAARSNGIINFGSWPSDGTPRAYSVRDDSCAVKFAPGAAEIIAGCWDGTVHLLPLASDEVPRQLSAHITCVLDIEFSLDGSQVYTAGTNGDDFSIQGEIAAWTFPELQPTGVARQEIDSTIRSLAVHPGGQLLLAGTTSGRIFIWGIPELELISIVGTETGEGIPDVWDMEFSPDGQMVAIATDHGAQFLNGATFERIEGLRVSENVRSVAWSPVEEQTLVYTTENGAYLLRLESGEKSILLCLTQQIANFDRQILVQLELHPEAPGSVTTRSRAISEA